MHNQKDLCFSKNNTALFFSDNFLYFMFKDPKLILAIITVALVWGTTFLGIKIGVETIPAWFVAGFRQLLAGVILFVILIFQRKLKWIGWKNFGVQALLSSLMLVGANGLTTVAEQEISSSLASLINALSPVLIFIGSLIIGLERFTFRSLTGLLLGFLGIIFIFWDGLSDLQNPAYLGGIILIFLAILCWAIGTIYTKKINLNKTHIFLNLFYQFIFAGIVQLIFAFVFSEEINPSAWSSKSILAIVYLAIFGSVLAFFAYHSLLQKLLATQVSMLSYANTIVAILLGWLILDEEITLKFIMAAALIICGVFIINYRPGMFPLKSKSKSK